MDNSLQLCRLCYAPVDNGTYIFRKPLQKKQNYSQNILEFFQITLEERSEWSTEACKKCVDFIEDIKSFKGQVQDTQNMFLNAAPHTEVLYPMEDDFICESPAPSPAQLTDSEETPPPSPEKIKKPTEVLLPMEDHLIPESPVTSPPQLTDSETKGEEPKSESPPTGPRTRGHRQRGEAKCLPKGLKGNVAPLPPRRRQTRKELLEEAKDPSYVMLEKPKPRQLQTANQYNVDRIVDEMDKLNRIDDRVKQRQRDVKEGTTMHQRRTRGDYQESWDQRFAKKYPHLKKLVQELKVDVCYVCKKATKTLGHLFTHMEREHGIHRYNAYIACCDKRFANGASISHLVYHHNNDAHKCETCDRRFLTKGDLHKHKRSHGTAVKEDLKLHCPKCDKGFRTKSTLRKHEERHLWLKFDCPECKEMFLTADFLQSHVDFEHNNIPRHICDVCGKGYKNISQLTAHQKKHLEVKTVDQCDVCGFYFRDVALHKQRSHTPVALVTCPDCGKQLNPKSMKNHHKFFHSAQPKTFQCTFCPKVFSSKERLKAHTDIHLGVRHPCFFCNEHYGNTRNRHKHLQTRHTAEYAEYKIQLNLQKAAKYQLKEDVVQEEAAAAAESL